MYTIHNTTGDVCPINDRIVGETYPDHPKPASDTDVFKYADVVQPDGTKHHTFLGWVSDVDWKAVMAADDSAFKRYIASKRIKIQAEIAGRSGTGETKSVLKSALNSVMALNEQFLSGELSKEEYEEAFETLKR